MGATCCRYLRRFAGDANRQPNPGGQPLVGGAVVVDPARSHTSHASEGHAEMEFASSASSASDPCAEMPERFGSNDNRQSDVETGGRAPAASSGSGHTRDAVNSSIPGETLPTVAEEATAAGLPTYDASIGTTTNLDAEGNIAATAPELETTKMQTSDVNSNGGGANESVQVQHNLMAQECVDQDRTVAPTEQDREQNEEDKDEKEVKEEPEQQSHTQLQGDTRNAFPVALRKVPEKHRQNDGNTAQSQGRLSSNSMMKQKMAERRRRIEGDEEAQ